MIKFLKIVWILSIFIIVFFHIIFESFRISDFIKGNYSVETMKIKNYNYSSSSRHKSITINGNIYKEKVYFSRFDNKIEELFSLYPGIIMEKNEFEESKSIFPNIFKNNHSYSKNIKVLKFQNSDIVMLVKDNEFQRWKIRLYLFSIYCLISIIILVLHKKAKLNF